MPKAKKKETAGKKKPAPKAKKGKKRYAKKLLKKETLAKLPAIGEPSPPIIPAHIPAHPPSEASEVDKGEGGKNAEAPQKKEKVVVRSFLTEERVITENSDPARELYNKSRFGMVLEGGKVQLSLLEGLYLLEKEKLVMLTGNNRRISPESFIKKAKSVEPNFWVRYCVFKDIRNRGYIIKTALKFGADFRVYDRGVKPGEDHARWVIYPVHEGSTITWYEFAAKNRVAHSTKKRLLIGIVDDEGDVTYYEIRWMRP
ncbi:tRNA-intron lyase [Candidatus Woesearchaeota archaeon CG_4_10_14_0_8_um_filter_47_5]|nr:MAG: tRNA-intron lyase [Candidatus Woesearchaeota archaeon CG_4_10_14_0_8_um_filter_47_5]